MNDKPVDALTISDLRRYPVWEFDLSRACEPGRDETWVTPVETLPVADLANRLVGVEARMANGEPLLCLLGNIHLQHERKTRQFLTLTAYNTQGEHFFLARYFDSDDARQGPAALADFLGLSVTEVFPITYDISALATGLEAVCKGTIPLAATERLSDAALMALIFE